MRATSIKALLYSLLAALCWSPALLAQSHQPVAAQPQFEEKLLRDPAQRCSERTDRLFELTLRELREERAIDLPAIASAVHGAARIGAPDNFHLLSITQGPLPVVVASYSCAMDATDFQGRFRVFAAKDGRYAVVARSEDYSVLAEVDVEGYPVSAGVVSMHAFPSEAADRAHLVTQWTRGGGSPAPFSLVVWNWDGRNFEPIWRKVEIKQSSAEFLGPLLLVELLNEGDHDEHSPQAYRINGREVIFDGNVDSALLERYISTEQVRPQTAAELTTLAGLFQSTGDSESALMYFTRSLAVANDASDAYLYRLVADLNEKLGRPAVAMDVLKQYQTRHANELTSEAQQELARRITTLKQRALSQ